MLDFLFNRKKRKINKHNKNLDDLLYIQSQFNSASGGINKVSHLLYNFLKHQYVPFSLKSYTDCLGEEVELYTASSSELVKFIDDVEKLPEYEYSVLIKNMKEFFNRKHILFGDWYDNDQSLKEILPTRLSVILLMFIRSDMLNKEQNEMGDAQYHDMITWVKGIDKRHPGIQDFINSTDYRVLLTEVLNLLLALERITLRSLGESTEN